MFGLSAGAAALTGIAGGAILGGVLAPDAPDTSGINKAAVDNSAIAGRQQDLAEQQYADQKALLDQYAPLFKEQITKQLTAQDKATSQSDAQWNSYLQNFAPLEQKLAQQAANYDTPARREEAAAAARGEVASNFDALRQQQNDSLAAGNVQPGSGAAMALGNATAIEEAKAKAGAANTARTTVEDKGMAYLDNATRFGRNMPSTGLQTAAFAGQSGNQALGAYGGLQSATAAPATTANGLYGSAVNSNASAGSLYGSAAGLKFAGDQAYTNSIMGGIGGGLQAYGMGMFGSSEKTKKKGKKVGLGDAVKAVEASPSYAWRYKPGMGDGDTKPRMGPMAESLHRAAPTVSDGKQVDAISMIGLHHAAIAGLAHEVRALKRGKPANDKSAGLQHATIRKVK
jgi:hypothetical protein